MQFIARKGNKERIISTENNYLIIKEKFKNSLQAEIAWKQKRGKLRKLGWQITVTSLSISSEKREEPSVPPQRREKKKRIVRLFGYKTIVEE